MVTSMRMMGNCLSLSDRPKKKVCLPPFNIVHFFTNYVTDWEEAYSNLKETLNLPPDAPIPKLPRTEPSLASSHPLQEISTKRKTAGEPGDVEMTSPDENRPKHTEPVAPSAAADVDQTRIHAQAAASYIPFLQTENLLPPKMPTREEMEAVLLRLRKQALVEEYFGGEDAA